MLSKIFKTLFIFIVGMVGGIFSTQILWPSLVEKQLLSKYKIEAPVQSAQIKEVIVKENTLIVESVDKVEKAVVKVRAQAPGKTMLEGFGIITTSDGLMVTLSDLIPLGSNFTFFVEGKTVDFQVLKRDTKFNLALVKLEGNNFHTVEFVDGGKVAIGERVFLVGENIVNEGIVRNLDENFIYTNIFDKKEINGTPLFNIERKLVGVNSVNKQGQVVAINILKIKEFLGF